MIHKKVSKTGAPPGPITVRYTAGFKLPYRAQYSMAMAEISAEMTGPDGDSVVQQLEEFVWCELNKLLQKIEDDGPSVQARSVRSQARKMRTNHGED